MNLQVRLSKIKLDCNYICKEDCVLLTFFPLQLVRKECRCDQVLQTIWLCYYSHWSSQQQAFRKSRAWRHVHHRRSDHNAWWCRQCHKHASKSGERSLSLWWIWSQRLFGELGSNMYNENYTRKWMHLTHEPEITMIF